MKFLNSRIYSPLLGGVRGLVLKSFPNETKQSLRTHLTVNPNQRRLYSVLLNFGCDSEPPRAEAAPRQNFFNSSGDS